MSAAWSSLGRKKASNVAVRRRDRLGWSRYRQPTHSRVPETVNNSITYVDETGSAGPSMSTSSPHEQSTLFSDLTPRVRPR